ncbi:H-NS family nucleoid-associated regulatory protein [Reyranella sp.]|uniref:H-NS histone family protein n=1 Tax=Reyranella sp. TaxID=1929291 RepID=UPI003D0DE167
MIERKIKELQAEAAAIRRSEQEGVNRLRAVIEKYKLGPDHFKMAMNGIGMPRNARSRSKLKTAPKYRNPDHEADVWSGRGRRPAFLIAALNADRSIEELAIREQQEESSDEAS